MCRGRPKTSCSATRFVGGENLAYGSYALVFTVETDMFDAASANKASCADQKSKMESSVEVDEVKSVYGTNRSDSLGTTRPLHDHSDTSHGLGR